MGYQINTLNIINTLLTLLAVFLFGCNSGFKGQDPLEGQPDNVRQAIPPKEKVDSPADDVLPEDSLLIDAELFYEFTEGEDREVVISSRSMLPDTTYTLELEGVEQILNSATVTMSPDGHVQTLKWTPPEGFVGDLLMRKEKIRAVIYAKRGKTHIIRTQDIPIFVYRQERKPEVLEIINFPETTGIHEGERVFFNVVVRDPESVSVATPAAVVGTPPLLRAVRTNERNDLTPFLNFIENPSRSKTDPELWTFHVSINLSGEKNLTQKISEYYFGLQAINRHVVASEIFTQKVNVHTSIFPPNVSWVKDESVIFQEGKENYFSFVIFDSREEGEVSIEWVTDWRKYPGLAVSCKKGDNFSKIYCSIMWLPQTLAEFELPKFIKLEFKITTFIDDDKQLKEELVERELLIQKKGQPPVLSEWVELRGGKLIEKSMDFSMKPL